MKPLNHSNTYVCVWYRFLLFQSHLPKQTRFLYHFYTEFGITRIRIFGIQGLSATYGIIPCWMILILQVIAESVMIGLFMEGCRKMAERIRVSSYTVIAATSFLIACELFISMI